MRKHLLLLLAFLMHSIGIALAIPADPTPLVVTQPDGSRLTICLKGDEYLSYYTTADGYTIIKNKEDFYVYAEIENGNLVASQRKAHDVGQRTPDEQEWLQHIGKPLIPKMSEQTVAERNAEMQRRSRARQRAMRREPIFDYSDFKGLVILVEMNDKEFTPDFKSFAEDMLNKENYKGYDNSSLGRFTGSVHDYFRDNSTGQFAPQFKVIGPIKINYSQFEGRKNYYRMTRDAIIAADEKVDYKEFSHNGVVDMVYFIFAGHASSVTGNNPDLLWPHADEINDPDNKNSSITRDGVTFDRYACSTELGDSEQKEIWNGIGTICHEFSHVLGLPDLYDTNYEKNGQSIHPHFWSIMAGGGHLNHSRTPAGYGLYERYVTGFAMPEVISTEGTYTLREIASSNTGYRINSAVDKEFFLLENRQNTSKWDQYLPGHGMLVFRVDSTNTDVWKKNKVNYDSIHNYYEMVRAIPSKLDKDGFPICEGSDPFPGSYGVTLLDNSTWPANLHSATGQRTPFGLSNIEENNGIITFKVVDENRIRNIIMSEPSILLDVGKEEWLKATTFPIDLNCTVEWQTSNAEIALVDCQGKVTAVAPGKAEISAIVNGDQSQKAICLVEVIDDNHMTESYGLKYWFDDQKELAGLIENYNAAFSVDVSKLSDGPHALHVAVYDQDAEVYLESGAQTYYFVKQPVVNSGSCNDYFYYVDGQEIAQSISNLDYLHEATLSMPDVSEGIHLLTTMVKSPGQTSTSVTSNYFLRAATAEDLGSVRLSCRVDNNDMVTLQRGFAGDSLNYEIDVKDLSSGLHRLTWQLISGNEILNIPPTTTFFMVDAKVKTYEYWLNGDRSTLTKVTSLYAGNPYELVTELKVRTMPLRSSVFHFAVEDGQPVVYPVNDLTIRFTNSEALTADSTVQYIDVNSKKLITQNTLLNKSEPTTVVAPAANTIKWFSLKAYRGNGIQLQTNRPCTIQLFAPDGEEIYHVSGDAAKVLAGMNGKMTGMYYVAVHDISDGEDSQEITISYNLASSSELLRGDVNDDGIVDAKDVVSIINKMMGIPTADFNEAAADVNGNGVIDIADVIQVVSIIQD